jgi:hypothetical protein
MEYSNILIKGIISIILIFFGCSSKESNKDYSAAKIKYFFSNNIEVVNNNVFSRREIENNFENQRELKPLIELDDLYEFYYVESKYRLRTMNFKIPIKCSSEYISNPHKASPDIIKLNQFLKTLNKFGYKISRTDLIELVSKTQVFCQKLCQNPNEYLVNKLIPNYNVGWSTVVNLAEGCKVAGKKLNEQIDKSDYNEVLNEMKKNGERNPEKILDESVNKYLNRFNTFCNQIDSLSNLKHNYNEIYMIPIQTTIPYPIFKFKITVKNDLIQISKEVLNPESFHPGYIACL